MDKKLVVSYAPHIRSAENVCDTMVDVLIGLMPALCAAVYFFGVRALLVTVVSVISCVAFETLWNLLIKRKNTISDLSACVTGVLLAFCLPPAIPLWMVVVGALFAMVVVKGFFGGLGQNIVNPALAARAFMLACWPADMTAFSLPGTDLFAADVVSSATPLAQAAAGDAVPSYYQLFFGSIPGCIGEVSAAFILIGGIYLLLRKKINLVIPLTYILSVGVFGFVFSKNGMLKGDFLFSILTGGVMLAGFFMATDYVTSPVTKKGQFVFALLAAFITVIIRTYGGYPEGVTYGILFANITVPLIDKFTRPKKFGFVKPVKQRQVKGGAANA